MTFSRKITKFFPTQVHNKENTEIIEDFNKALSSTIEYRLKKKMILSYSNKYLNTFLLQLQPPKSIYETGKIDYLFQFINKLELLNEIDVNDCALSFFTLYAFMRDSNRMPNLEIEVMFSEYQNRLTVFLHKLYLKKQINDEFKNISKDIIKSGIDPNYLRNKAIESIDNYSDEETLAMFKIDENRTDLLKLSKKAKNLPKQLYQIKISIQDSKPLIWRRFIIDSLVPLNKLHKYLQTIMGWKSRHLHEFEIQNLCFGSPDEEDFLDDDNTIDENNISLRCFNLNEGDSFEYIYDFGDDWRHTLIIEKIIAPNKDSTSPICLEMERNCPIEDIGGIYSFNKIIKLMNNPIKFQKSHFAEFIPNSYNPDYCNLEKVNLLLKPKKIIK